MFQSKCSCIFESVVSILGVHVMSSEVRFVTPAKACQVLGVSRQTLRDWSRDGKIRYAQSGPSAVHRYDLSSVIKKFGGAENESSDTGRVDIIYARVSTRAQQKYLSTQSTNLSERYGKCCTVITDIGSDLNFKRAGFKKILEKVVRGKVRKLYVSHKDRLCRFAFDLVNFICTRHGTEIIVAEDGDSETPESELAKDVLSIITVFGARLYGSRGKRGSSKRSNGSKNTIEGTVEELQNQDVP
eukprot:1776422-Rhodomonas_salina.1